MLNDYNSHIQVLLSAVFVAQVTAETIPETSAESDPAIWTGNYGRAYTPFVPYTYRAYSTYTK